jgi:phage I-like protein
MATRSNTTSIAALSVDLAVTGAAPTEFRLLPYGRFQANDGSGRPADVPGGCWLLDRAGAEAIAATFGTRADAMVIDYEHQTLNAPVNGKPAPAAGWIGGLEARDDGLYAVDVEWTAAAAEMVGARQYRYVSPVFLYSKATGQVLGVVHAALVNYAGLDGLTDLAALAALAAQFSAVQPEQENSMNELLKKLLAALGLQESATEEAALSAMAALKAQSSRVGPLDAELAALRGAAPDPAKYVPMTQHAQVQNELAALTAKVEAAERDGLMNGALGDGRILPAQEAYWRAQPVAALKAYLEVAQPIGALKGLQTGGQGGAGTSQPAGADLAVMKAMGLTPEQFAAGKQEV